MGGRERNWEVRETKTNREREGVKVRERVRNGKRKGD